MLVVDFGPREHWTHLAMKTNFLETMITLGEEVLGLHTYEEQTTQQLVALNIQERHRPVPANVSSKLRGTIWGT